jgi:hypothetical protein
MLALMLTLVLTPVVYSIVDDVGQAAGWRRFASRARVVLPGWRWRRGRETVDVGGAGRAIEIRSGNPGLVSAEADSTGVLSTLCSPAN